MKKLIKKSKTDFVLQYTDFEENVGAILRAGLDIESKLSFTIMNYFVWPQNKKTFFFKDVILFKLSFESKKQIFSDICKEENLFTAEIKDTIKAIDFVQVARNKVAHHEAFINPGEFIKLRPLKSNISGSEITVINRKLVQEVEEKRLKATNGIISIHLKLEKEFKFKEAL